MSGEPYQGYLRKVNPRAQSPGPRGLREECGVFGVLGTETAAQWVYLGLFALQHRGQEGCGIVSFDSRGRSEDSHERSGGQFHQHKGFGLVTDNFSPNRLARLKGVAAIGHVRYSTQGGRLIQNVQPFFCNTALGGVAVSHNGNLTNGSNLRRELEDSGSIFQSTSDTEVLIHLIARARGDKLIDRLIEVLPRIQGAYSMVIMDEKSLIGVRDRFGFRPLVIGKRDECYVLASETCALDLIDAEFEREVEPGEIVQLTSEGIVSHFPFPKTPSAHCAFEPIYFSRPDSVVFGSVTYELRKKMGVRLAEEAPPLDGEVVVAVPDSGVPMAMGYAEKTGLPIELGLVRNHYVGRTFIEPAQEIRDFGVKLKLNPIVSALKGKSVVVVDDSIVRGTTSVKIMRMLRKAGVKKIHMRIGSPPITHSCFYGVDTPQRTNLLAAQKSVDKIRDFIGCDTLAYLSVAGLKATFGGRGYCTSCFNGEYPEDICQSIEPQPTDEAGGPGLKA